MEDIRVREDDATRLQARARIESMALALGREVVEVPGDGNYFLHAARFTLLQLHGWNYDLVPTHERMKISLDDGRSAWQDLRPILQMEWFWSHHVKIFTIPGISG